MTPPDSRPVPARRAFAVLFATSMLLAPPLAATTAWSAPPGHDPGAGSNVVRTGWHHAAADTAALPPGSLAWSFAAAKQAGGDAWTAERGRITPGDGEARLQPDTSRRVILVSPPGLPEAVRDAEEFVVGVTGDAGLQRVRIQARRDARGGWITIADGKGTALRATPAGIAVKRSVGARDQPIERLRVELSFRTTNPRGLVSIAAVPGPR